MTYAFHRELERAGLVHPESGKLPDSPWLSFPVEVPYEIELDSDRLRYSLKRLPDTDKTALKADPRGMLDAFARLRDPEGVLRFAKRYGVLQICEHMAPASHNPGAVGLDSVTPCGPMRDESGLWEPLVVWLGFAEQARAMLMIGASLNKGKPGGRDDWFAALATFPEPVRSVYASMLAKDESLKFSRENLGAQMNRWLLLGSPKLWIDWPGGKRRPGIRILSRNFGHIALGLAAALSLHAGVSICDGCGSPYPVSRKPRSDRRNFCGGCQGTPLPARLRKQDWRAKEEED